MEENKEGGAIPFLGTTVKPEADGGLSITVYRKPTYTDQYLQLDSHHQLSDKYSVINTLTNRPKQFAITSASQERNGLSQEGTHSLQVPQTGHRQGGKKALKAYY